MLILNSKGEKVKLNAIEDQQSKGLEQLIKNSTGYEVDVTTLTTIMKRMVDQRFFTIRPSEYMPVKVGEGAWSSELLTYRNFDIAGDFETGNVNTAGSNSKLAEADTAIDSVTVKVVNWAKTIGWTVMDLAMASKAGNWDLIVAKEKARKRNWDLGIQRISFLGSENDSAVLGLLTQTDVTSNTALITKYIKSMTAAEFNTFLSGLYEAYRTNAEQTSVPTHFIIPEADFNGLANFPDSTYPLKTRLQIIEENLKLLTNNPNFKVLPCSYADQANNIGTVAAAGKNRYTFLRYDEDSVRVDIPFDYTGTMANSVNSFQFNNVGYGQYTGAKAYRPKELLYFDFAV